MNNRRPEKINTIIAFDYGKKHIGVATGQTITKTATPLKIISNKNEIPDWGNIEELLKEWKPDMIVVGLPLNMDDTESLLSEAASKFSRQLFGRFNIYTELMDERLTTREAKQACNESNKRNQLVDDVAASIILQSWLNNNFS